MSKLNKNKNHVQYTSGMTRRQSLKIMGMLSLSAMLPALSACDTQNNISVAELSSKGHWPELKLPPITASGYGKDPNLVIAMETPWPRTLSDEQLTTVSILADIVVPREGSVPSASEVNVPDVIDEWVSAPYSRQQADRLTILSALAWFDQESQNRYLSPFRVVSAKEQLNIINDIAFDKEDLAAEFVNINRAFKRFSELTLAAFFCTPEGTRDLGYVGNVPIAGDYPGPTQEAISHLDQVLKELNLR